MPTPTETHLQVIAEKIEAIKELNADVSRSSPSFRQLKSAIPHLKSIGHSVSHIPEEFRNRHIEETWRIMELWGVRGHLSIISLKNRYWAGIISVLLEIEPEIRRHTGGYTEIQKEMIRDQREKYNNLHKTRKEEMIIPYLLIGITSSFAAIGLQSNTDGMDYTRLEQIAYFSHMLVVLSIPFILGIRPKDLILLYSRQNLFHTFSENFSVLHLELEIKIRALRQNIVRIVLYRNLLMLSWAYTLLFAIFVTLS